jgi:hypothetical protein
MTKQRTTDCLKFQELCEKTTVVKFDEVRAGSNGGELLRLSWGNVAAYAFRACGLLCPPWRTADPPFIAMDFHSCAPISHSE